MGNKENKMRTVEETVSVELGISSSQILCAGDKERNGMDRSTSFYGYGEKRARDDLSGFPWLNPKLELTIMATQKAAKRRRKGQSRHLRSWRMTPPPGSWSSAAAKEG